MFQRNIKQYNYLETIICGTLPFHCNGGNIMFFNPCNSTMWKWRYSCQKLDINAASYLRISQLLHNKGRKEKRRKEVGGGGGGANHCVVNLVIYFFLINYLSSDPGSYDHCSLSTLHYPELHISQIILFLICPFYQLKQKWNVHS